MRFLLAASLLVLAAAAPATALDLPQVPPTDVNAPRAGEIGRPIVVTGIRIQDYRDRLAACLARHCPVNEDVDATLALAEAYFLNGDYGPGRQAVRASIGRNRDQASAFPEPVSDLFRAHTRLSRHLGYDDQAARSANDILRALQAGIPQEDYRHFTARLEIADLQMGMGNANRARRELAELIRAARAANRDDVVAMAELRTIWFDYIVDAYGDSKSRLIEMTLATDPAQRFRANGAKVLLARIYRSENNTARADALLAEVGRGDGAQAQRRLISSPPYALQAHERTNAMELIADSGTRRGLESIMSMSNASHRVTDNFQDKWIDVGFWVMPDGRVSSLEIVRRSADAQWADPLVESIEGRVYSTGPEPTYRLERYTYTSGYTTATGTHMQQHSPNARVEYLDLTANAPGSSPPSP
jgi:hypothetical protein